jgi:hypothetical protein
MAYKCLENYNIVTIILLSIIRFYALIYRPRFPIRALRNATCPKSREKKVL